MDTVHLARSHGRWALFLVYLFNCLGGSVWFRFHEYNAACRDFNWRKRSFGGGFLFEGRKAFLELGPSSLKEEHIKR